MKKLLICVVSLFLFAGKIPDQSNIHLFPYIKAGLTEQQAASHLLERFTFGTRSNDIDVVINLGLENWFELQLKNDFTNNQVNKKLSDLDLLNLTNSEIAVKFPNPGYVLIEAIQEGVIPKDREGMTEDEVKEKVIQFAIQKGYRAQKELNAQMYAQKIFRAVYSENQLQEVLTDFWFNHFNVSATDNQARAYIMNYERDAIRPNVLANFHTLLEATAKHPAMLFYLDNAQSTAPDSVNTTMKIALDQFKQMKGIKGWFARRSIEKTQKETEKEKGKLLNGVPEEFRPKKGLNENYARELMELHTLGVDGGYTQKDVTEVARAFTGWTVYPLNPNKGNGLIKRLEKNGDKVGFVRQGDFLFRADTHDAAEKLILGKPFSAGRSLDEGEEILQTLSESPATAKFISWKLAVRFVSDNPSEELINQLSKVFIETHGDIKKLLWAIVESPEFWNDKSRRSKIKSPFELVVSSLRATNADIENINNLVQWMDKMGQPIYRYQAPTGFPDKAENWINSGSLLNRMNYGLSLANGKIKGVHIDLAELNHNHEPESAESALTTYSSLLMPERDLSETIHLLTPVIQSPDFANKLTQTENKPKKIQPDEEINSVLTEDDISYLMDDEKDLKPRKTKETKMNSSSNLAQIVGVILGSPEFQRR